MTDDEHIFDLIRSKLTDFRTFHTMLYTCAAEFDFMPVETLVILSKTLLLPSAIVTVLAVLVVILNIPSSFRLYTSDCQGTNETTIKTHSSCEDVQAGPTRAGKP